MTLRACHAGWRLQNGKSIAQAIADTLNTTVYAWKKGLFFSLHQDAVNPYTYGDSKGNEHIPANTSSPVYLMPWGGMGVAPCIFRPNQPEPIQCLATPK